MRRPAGAACSGCARPRDSRGGRGEGIVRKRPSRPVVLFEYAAGDIVMRNIALAALRQLGFRGRVVAAVLGLTENYVATLHNAAKRDGSAALIRQDRRGGPGKVTAARWAQARAWRELGVSGAETGRRLKVAHTTISRGLGPRGQAPASGGGPGQHAPAEPLFTGAEAEALTEPGAGAGGLPPGWPLTGGSRRGMPGRCCCTRSSRGPARTTRRPGHRELP